MEELRKRSETITQRIDKIKSRLLDEDSESLDSDQKSFINQLRNLCSLIREGENSQYQGWDKFLINIEQILNDAIGFAYGDFEVFDFLPSYADTPQSTVSPLIEDPLSEGILGIGCKHLYK